MAPVVSAKVLGALKSGNILSALLSGRPHKTLQPRRVFLFFFWCLMQSFDIQSANRFEHEWRWHHL